MAKINAQPTIWNRTKQGFRRAGRALRKTSIMLPLVATIMLGCGTPVPGIGFCPNRDDPCNSYNDTTVTINHGEFDGSRPVASVDRLRQPDGFMGEELGHALWATHMLSTEPLPADFEATVTRLDDVGCFYRPEREHPLTAFAQGPHNPCDLTGVFGMYTHLDQLTLDNFSLIAHEFGHIQGRAGETAAEINAVEQGLMLSVVYANQGSWKDGVQWAAQNTNGLFGMLDLRNAVKRIDNEDALEAIQSQKYASANIFIIDRLGKHDGDFAAIREETDGLWKRPLLDEIDRKVASFIDGYAGVKRQVVFAGIIAKVRIAFMKELRHRFGEEMASSFFYANSYAAYSFIDSDQISMVYGLQGWNCAPLIYAESREGGVCTEPTLCEEWGADRSFRLTGAKFLCSDMSNQTWEVTANGTQYLTSHGKVMAQGIECNGVVVFDEIIAQVPVGL